MVYHISFWIRPFQLYRIVDRPMPTVSGTTVEGIADLMVDVNTKHHQRITGDSLETWSFLPWIFCRLCGSMKGRFNMRSTREGRVIDCVSHVSVTSGVNRGRWLVQRYSFKNTPDLPSREIVPWTEIVLIHMTIEYAWSSCLKWHQWPQLTTQDWLNRG